MDDPVDKEDDDAKSEELDGFNGYEELGDMGEQPFEYDPEIPEELENKQRTGV